MLSLHGVGKKPILFGTNGGGDGGVGEKRKGGGGRELGDLKNRRLTDPGKREVLSENTQGEET